MTWQIKKAGRITLLVGVGALWACDIPTAMPRMEQEWILPIAGTSIEVGEFLPDLVGLNEDSSAFTLQVEKIHGKMNGKGGVEERLPLPVLGQDARIPPRQEGARH